MPRSNPVYLHGPYALPNDCNPNRLALLRAGQQLRLSLLQMDDY